MKDLYLSSIKNEDLENLRNLYLKEIKNIAEEDKNNEVNLVNSYLGFLLKVFKFDDLDFPLKYEVLEEIWKRNLRVLLKFSRMLLSDNNFEYFYDYEKVVYVLTKYSLNNKSNLLKELKLDKPNNELWQWPFFDSSSSNNGLEITNWDLSLYIDKFISNWETLSNIVSYYNNKWNIRLSELKKEDNIDDIRNNIETQKIDYIYNILDHYEYFSNEFNLSEYIEEIKSLKNNKDNDNYKQIVLFLSNIQFINNWTIKDELLNIIWEINEIKIEDFELIEDEEEKVKLFEYLKKVNSENKSLGLIFFNSDLRWADKNSTWIEDLIYEYKTSHYILESKDSKRINNMLNLYSRKWKLVSVIYLDKSMLLMLDTKDNVRHDEVLVFNLKDKKTTNEYFEKNMKNIIKDFIINKLNTNEWKNFKILQKSKFFIS